MCLNLYIETNIIFTRKQIKPLGHGMAFETGQFSFIMKTHIAEEDSLTHHQVLSSSDHAHRCPKALTQLGAARCN